MKYVAALAVLAAVAAPALADVPEQVKAAIRQLKEGSDDEKVRAVRAIKAMGPDGAAAIPALTEALKDGLPIRRAEIAQVLATFGPAAKEAIPVLVATLHEPRVDHTLFTEAINAVAALGEPGNRDVVRLCLFQENYGRGGKFVSTSYPSFLIKHAAVVVPVVADLLADADHSIRYRAAVSMAQLVAPSDGKPAPASALSQSARESAVAALQTALDDPSLSVRSWAAAALLDLDPASLPKAVPAILTAVRKHDAHGSQTAALVRAGMPAARLVVEYLNEPTSDDQQPAIACLAQFGDVALPALSNGLRHPGPRVREGVLRTLQYANRGAKLRTEVVARLRDPEARVRLAAAATLIAADVKRADVAVPVLAELAFDHDQKSRVEALIALRQFGPAARPAIPALLRRVRTGDFDTRLCAAEALKEADRSTWKTYVPVLIGALKSEMGWHRERAIIALRDTGQDARAALPALRDRFTDDDPRNRVLAAEAVYKISPDAVADVVACLIDVLKNPDRGGRSSFRLWRSSFRVLEKIGPAAKAAIPALVELIHADPDASVAPEAAALAIRLDPENADRLYDLFRIHLSPGNPDADEHWLYWVGLLKKLAKPLIPDMIAALGSKYTTQREGALDALVALGPDAKDALPALRELAKGSKDAKRIAEVIAAIEKK
jgi:HEAT repeat protein